MNQIDFYKRALEALNIAHIFDDHPNFGAMAQRAEQRQKFFLFLLKKNYMLRFQNNNHKNLYLLVRAVNHAKRREIIQHLADKKTACVTSIYYELKCDQSIASQHLKILRDAKVVTVQRVGRFKHYTLNESRVEELDKLTASFS